MAGRRPKPTVLRELGGNAGHRPIPKAEPKPAALAETQAPEWLPDDAQEFWAELSPMLLSAKVLTEFDRPALLELVAVYSLWRQSYRAVQEKGSVYESETESGAKIYRPNPAANQEAERWKRFRLMLIEFGMTPAARSRVARASDDSKEEDPLSEWLAQ